MADGANLRIVRRNNLIDEFGMLDHVQQLEPRFYAPIGFGGNRAYNQRFRAARLPIRVADLGKRMRGYSLRIDHAEQSAAQQIAHYDVLNNWHQLDISAKRHDRGRYLTLASTDDFDAQFCACR